MTRIARIPVLAAALFSAPALAGDLPAAQFSDAIDDFGVTRHVVEAPVGSTWSVSIEGDAAARMFVSTESGFRPHDAPCASETECTITVADGGALYIHVLGEESVSYGVTARPLTLAASL